MGSGKAIFAILAGVALTTAIGILLSPYRDSSKRKKIVENSNERAEKVGKTIKEIVNVARNNIKEMDEDANRMINEGGL